MITFLLCKFFSSVVVEEHRNTSFCCGGANPKAASNRPMNDGEMRIQHGVNKLVQSGDRVKEELGVVFENSGVEDEAVKVEEELGKDQESILGCDGMKQKVFDESPVRENFGVEDEAVKVEEEELGKDQENILGCDGMEQKVVDESAVRTKSREIEVELGDMGGGDSGEIGIEFGEREGVGKAPNKVENESSEDNDELFDDWEDVERTELEKSFDAAVVFADSNANSDQFDNDLKMQLYGLHKIATDGPCSTAQPMALKVSARAKWTAWHSLGDISREEAMELYITLLSSVISDWKNEQ